MLRAGCQWSFESDVRLIQFITEAGGPDWERMANEPDLPQGATAKETTKMHKKRYYYLRDKAFPLAMKRDPKDFAEMLEWAKGRLCETMSGSMLLPMAEAAAAESPLSHRGGGKKRPRDVPDLEGGRRQRRRLDLWRTNRSASARCGQRASFTKCAAYNQASQHCCAVGRVSHVSIRAALL